MATIEEIFEKEVESLSVCGSKRLLKDDPDLRKKIFAPLTKAGFKDFIWLDKSGSSSFYVAPCDNKNIVFRVTEESTLRRDDIPFFLTSPYEHCVSYDTHKPPLRLEILLTGNNIVSGKDKNLLFNEMALAGWEPEKITAQEAFWKDVIAIKIRGSDGRIKTAPIISDPSAIERMRLAKPTGPWEELNKCSSDYPTLQDQADAYNAIIDADPRLKKLVPEPIEFEKTEVIPAPPKKSAGAAK